MFEERIPLGRGRRLAGRMTEDGAVEAYVSEGGVTERLLNGARTVAGYYDEVCPLADGRLYARRHHALLWIRSGEV